MSDPDLPTPLPDDPLDGVRAWCHIIYGLHALAVLVGVLGTTTIAGAFVFGVPSLLAVILNYIKQGEVKNTWLESHFRWQIRTFWFTVLWLVVYGILFITVVGLVIAIPMIWVLGIWVAYRVIRGWLALLAAKPLG